MAKRSMKSQGKLTAKQLAKVAQQRMVLAIMHNRGRRRWVTLKVLSRKTGLSLNVLNNYMHEWDDKMICAAIPVLSQDGTCAWGIRNGVELAPDGLPFAATKQLAIEEFNKEPGGL